MNKSNFLINALVALCLVFTFVQCNSNKQGSTTAVATSSEQTPDLTGMKIAYVEIDTLLSKYNFCIDLNEAMVKKGENVKLEISRKARDFEKQAAEFQEKLQNGVFQSKERAEQEQARLLKLKQNLEEFSAQLQTELMKENEHNNLLLRDSINAFLKVFNKTKHYSMIISNTGFDNLLYADSIYNITNEVVAGLNERYQKK